MNIRKLTQTIRTSRKRAALLGAAAAAVLLVAAFAGPHLPGAVGDGAGWVVKRVVRAVAYQNVSPESEATTLTARVRVAASTGTPDLPERQVAPVAGEPAADEAGADEKIPPLDLITPLEEETEVRREELPDYRSFGLRDPMLPLVTPDGEQDEEMRFSVYRLTLVGVAWRTGERVGLLEDPGRKSYLYRVGEWTKDGGRVADITENSITFTHVRFGEMTRFTLRLKPPKEEQ
ncbi:MAG: hypothetical protein ABIH26_00875 [Candidatus Eisenbacteria bacterium]